MTFWTIAWTDLKIAVRDKMFFFWLLLFPLLFAFLFGTVFREGSPGDTKADINILNQDGGILSAALVKELEDEKYAVNPLEAGQESVTRTLIIPEGFTEKVLQGEKVELILEKAPGSNMEAGQAAYAHILRGVIKIMTRLVSLAPENMEVLEDQFSKTGVNQIISLKAEQGGRLRIIPSGFNHSVPAITIMFLLFTVLMYGGINLLEERRQGQLERIILSSASFSSLIGGKWLARIMIGMLQIILMFAAGKLLFGIYLGESPAALVLISLFFCASISGLSLLFGSLIRKEEVLVVLNILAANLMAALGGCWWPLELVPEGIRISAFVFPTGWTMDAFNKLIFFGYGLQEVLPHVGALALFSLAFLFLAVKFFKLR